ncbi:vacuolar protein sorting-associated protein 36-like isoform X2 [Glycine soja]|uniref:vacuolar protein sorting-associated protein 36-like isoform X2 n=1 Tax=Glycine soja TaxID=3848 RepID=UPI001038B619|nr:vacuolar protein sorting-associated protein 36-like isoform X2 [Glycine soja]
MYRDWTARAYILLVFVSQIGFSAPQGCGKTTLVFAVDYLFEVIGRLGYGLRRFSGRRNMIWMFIYCCQESKAKEMVMLAEKMRLKLLSGSNSQTNATNDEEMGSKEEMQDWLLSVGIISPVTKESVGALYHQQLSRQLADFVKVPLEKAGGIINLIDIYCLFNHACGIGFNIVCVPSDMIFFQVVHFLN